jgi:hypothetical protein
MNLKKMAVLLGLLHFLVGCSSGLQSDQFQRITDKANESMINEQKAYPLLDFDPPQETGNQTLIVPGKTDPANTVVINNEEIAINADGSFETDCI